jgi:hypothetical protein
VRTTTIYLPVNSSDPLSETALLANAGAELTDGSGNPVPGTITADTAGVNATAPGNYTATIEGTDEFGIESAPVTVTVVIYAEAGKPNEESKRAEEVQQATEAKQQAEAAQHGAEAKLAEEGKHAAEAKQRAEAAERAAAEAKKSTGAHKSGGAPSAAPKLAGVKATAGQIRARVKVAGEGELTATATSGKLKVGSVLVKVEKGGMVQLKLPLTKGAKEQLAAHHSLKVTLKVTFKSAAGKVSTATKTVTLKQPAARRRVSSDGCGAATESGGATAVRVIQKAVFGYGGLG